MLAAIFVCAVIATILIEPRVEHSAVIAEATSIQNALLATGKVQRAGVMIQETWLNGETAHGIQLTLKCNEIPTDKEHLASEFANVALASDPQAAKKNFIRVTFAQDFNVGLAKFNKSWTDAKSPDEWKQLGR